MISLLFVLSVRGTELYAQNKKTNCAKVVHDKPIQSVVATASFFSNLRKSVGSISYESNAIFEKAKDQAATLTPPDNFCPKGCGISPRAVMVFQSAPQKVLTDYRDFDHCKALFESTTKEPLHYINPSIKTIDDLNDWISDLSQGSGVDGKDLYKKCDKSCSPQFEYVIAKNLDNISFTVQGTAICGDARDKSDNQYHLNSFFRWTCQDL